MPDLNDLNRPVTTDTEPNVLDTLRAHITRAATWTWDTTANRVAGMMSAVTQAVSGGRSMRLYRRNAANTADEEIVSLPGVSVGGNAATASTAATVSNFAITTDKLAAQSVTSEKLAAQSVTSEKLADQSVTAEKLAIGVGFPSGTRMPFAQSAAPTGWTQDVTDAANNRMLRVVNTAGGGVAGSHSPILNNVVPSHTHGFTTGAVSNDHAHFVNGSTSASGNHRHGTEAQQINLQNSGLQARGGSQVGALGGFTDYGGDHSHNFSVWTGGINSNHTHSGGTDNGSSQTNWQPRYIDMIICSKN